MDYLYTKNGRPLKRRGDDLFNSSGTHVGRIRREKVFDPSGRYAGTVVGERVIYRSTHNTSVGSPFAPRASAGFGRANRAGTGAWGDEPPFPD
jgi:hypothetical protein